MRSITFEDMQVNRQVENMRKMAASQAGSIFKHGSVFTVIHKLMMRPIHMFLMPYLTMKIRASHICDTTRSTMKMMKWQNFLLNLVGIYNDHGLLSIIFSRINWMMPSKRSVALLVKIKHDNICDNFQ